MRSPSGVLIAVVTLAGIAPLGCDEVPPARFPHEAHVAASRCGEPGLPECPTCLSCHEGIRKSEKLATVPPSSCAECHAPASADVQRTMARLGHGRAAGRGIEFVHADHVTLPEIRGQCLPCHDGVTTDGVSGSPYPAMATCLSCHADEFNQGQCTPCHDADAMRKLVPQTFLRHDVRFLRDHGQAATSRGNVCSQCHAQQECTNCHDSTQTLLVELRNPDAIDREFVHRGDIVNRHAIDARSAGPSCMRCHSTASCDGCHVQRGVSAARKGANNPHPLGWVGSDTGSVDFHGTSARRDIISCAACHDHGPATNCIQCHRVGERGGTPHPDGWRSGRSTSSGMCVHCHGTAAVP